jgi:hypothetical protein
MSRLTCTFCAHRNPEGSSYCNQCGSPLHLVPCEQCQAINNANDTHCYACGVSLTQGETQELAFAGFAEAEQFVDAGSTRSVRLADHLEDIAWDLPTRARAAERAAPTSASVPVERPEPEPIDDAAPLSPYASGRAYRPRSSRWPKRIVLGCALLAIAGVIAWSTLEIPLPWRAEPVTAPAPAPVPAATAPPAPSPAPPDTTVSPPAPVTDGNDEAPSGQTSGPARPEVAAPANPLAPVPAAPVRDAPAPATDTAAESSPGASVPEPGGTRGPRSAKTQSVGEARAREAAVTRTREQALRDAAATQRLIERQLADTPRSDGGTASPPP